MKRMQTKGIRLLMAVILLVSMVAVARGAAQIVNSSKVKERQYTVVIDAGHGKTAGRPKEFELECSVLSSVSCGGSII
ncbi:MAG: hypothetical protein GX234_05375 [Clostridiales bacterium]|nr:hypothetical protein [Clostridiales bacterium]